MRTILRIAEFLVEDFHDGEVDIVADKVGQSQRTHGMVGAKHHALVNVLGAGDTVGENAAGFVNHGDKDTVDDKAGSFLNLDGLFADRGGEVDDALANIVAGELATDYLDESHAVGGVEEVHTDELSGTAGASGDLSNGE